MRTIPAREIKRCGIGVVDRILEEGPVHVIKNDEPRYVIMTEAHYEELLEDREDALVARVQWAQQEVESGLARPTTAEELIAEFDLED
jgi:PHD/YefM family antitoxin component YafN of YafNO toxin-antitoxin module